VHEEHAATGADVNHDHATERQFTGG